MVVERADSAVDALVDLAQQNDVDCLVLGAARGRGAQDFADQTAQPPAACGRARVFEEG